MKIHVPDILVKAERRSAECEMRVAVLSNVLGSATLTYADESGLYYSDQSCYTSGDGAALPERLNAMIVRKMKTGKGKLIHGLVYSDLEFTKYSQIAAACRRARISLISVDLARAHDTGTFMATHEELYSQFNDVILANKKLCDAGLDTGIRMEQIHESRMPFIHEYVPDIQSLILDLNEATKYAATFMPPAYPMASVGEAVIFVTPKGDWYVDDTLFDPVTYVQFLRSPLPVEIIARIFAESLLQSDVEFGIGNDCVAGAASGTLHHWLGCLGCFSSAMDDLRLPMRKEITDHLEEALTRHRDCEFDSHCPTAHVPTIMNRLCGYTDDYAIIEFPSQRLKFKRWNRIMYSHFQERSVSGYVDGVQHATSLYGSYGVFCSSVEVSLSLDNVSQYWGLKTYSDNDESRYLVDNHAQDWIVPSGPIQFRGNVIPVLLRDYHGDDPDAFLSQYDFDCDTRTVFRSATALNSLLPRPPLS
jgi:hypothetical protein